MRFGTDLRAKDFLFGFFNTLQTVKLRAIEFAHTPRIIRQEIDRKTKFLQEFGDIEFELDEEETKSLIEMLSEPNPNAHKFRVRARQLFENTDLTADEIPIRIKSKRTE